jgi:hypothetical protein
LRLVVTKPVRPGDFLLASRALAAVFGPAVPALPPGATGSAADAAPSNADLVALLAGRDYTPDELEWLEVLYPEEEEEEEEGDDTDGNGDPFARQQRRRLERAGRLFAAAAEGKPSSFFAQTATACPLSRSELSDLVARTALAEPNEDAAAAALRAASGAGSAAVATSAPASSVTGLWPAFALANHSCAPTASATVVGSVLVLRASEPMLPGDEATVCYLGEARFAPVARRRAALRASHGFLCQCRRCLAEQRVFPTKYYPQDDVLLGLADDPEEEEEEEGEAEAEAAAEAATAAPEDETQQPKRRLVFPRRSLPARALGWAAALATGRGLAAAARAWRAGRPPKPRPAPDHRCLEETWLLATGPLAEDVRAARTATVRATGRREDAARAIDAARLRLESALAWAGREVVSQRRRPQRRVVGGGDKDEDGAADDGAVGLDLDIEDDDRPVPAEAAGWFAACALPLHRADAELSRLMASAAVELESGDFFRGRGQEEEDVDRRRGSAAPGEREMLTPLEDDLRARRGLAALRAAQRRRLAALGRCLSAAEAVARGSELHCALAVEHASLARTIAARAAAAAGAVDASSEGDEQRRQDDDDQQAQQQQVARAAASAALAADLRCARAHRERYGGAAECSPELVARLVAARRRATAGAALADRMGALAWGDALRRDRYSDAALRGRGSDDGGKQR